MKDDIGEKRKAAMHKYGYHAFIILASLVLLDGFVKFNGFNWCDPFTSSFIIVMTALLYLQVRLIFCGIYYKKVNVSTLFIANIVVSVITAFIVASVVAHFRGTKFISSGRLTDSCFQIFFAFYLTVTSIAAWIKFILDKIKS